MRKLAYLTLAALAVSIGWGMAQMERNVTIDVTQMYSAEPPAAGASGSLFEVDATVLAMDGGGDVVNGLFLDIVNADHTDAGGGNTLNGIYIDGITGDPQANEYALHFANGWDREIYSTDAFYLESTSWLSFTMGNGASTNLTDGVNNLLLIDDTAGTTTIQANATVTAVISASGILPVTYTNATLPASANGNIAYCSDCTIANPCAGGGNGAIAKRLNGAWVCN